MNKECGCSNYFCFHQHSVYSVRDGATNIKDLIKRHKELDMKYFLLTDHGNICGIYEAFTECEKNNIIPIIGCELYMPRLDGNDKKAHHITSVVLNENGWKNMLKLQYISNNKEDAIIDGFTGSFNYRPKVTLEMLEHYCKSDIMLTTGCRASLFNYLLLENKEQECINYILRFKENIKNFFIELHIANNEVEEQMYWFLKQQALKFDIPIIIANDTHYLNKNDLISWNLLTANRSNTSIFELDKMAQNDDFYIKSFEEVQDDIIRIESKQNPDITKEDINYLFDGFNKLTSLIDFKWENRKLPMLHFAEAEENLKRYLWQELKKEFNGSKNIPQDYINRLKEEWIVAKETNNISYFYMIQRFLSKCKESGLMMGMGRGSASSLLICKLIGASKVDPLKYGLIIERAMNIDRPKLMDVDLDFAKSEGEQAFKILQEMFGKDNVCNIVNFGYCGVKQAVQNVFRFLRIAPAIADKLTKELSQFEEEDEDGNKHTSKANQEQQMLLLQDHKFIKNYYSILPNGKEINGDIVIDLIKRNWNTINNLSIHASGVLIMNEPVYNYIPVVRVNNVLCSGFDMEVLEKLNGLKLDILKITTNDLIKESLIQIFDYLENK